MKTYLYLSFIVLLCLNLFGFINNVEALNYNNFKDTCSYIDYGTKNIKIWTSMTEIFKKYGEIEPNCEYGHGRGYAYFDPDLKVFLIFGYMDGGAEQIVIAKESALAYLKKVYIIFPTSWVSPTCPDTTGSLPVILQKTKI